MKQPVLSACLALLPCLALADLSLRFAPDSVDVDDGVYRPGQAINLRYTLWNTSHLPSGPFQVAAYASANTTISEDDVLLAVVSHSEVPTRASRPCAITVRLPPDLIADSYYIGVQIAGVTGARHSAADYVPIAVVDTPPACVVVQAPPPVVAPAPIVEEVWPAFPWLSAPQAVYPFPPAIAVLPPWTPHIRRGHVIAPRMIPATPPRHRPQRGIVAHPAPSRYETAVGRGDPHVPPPPPPSRAAVHRRGHPAPAPHGRR